MYWQSDSISAAQFSSQVSRDRDVVYVRGHVNGRAVHLSVGTAAELDAYMTVRGCSGEWRVTIKNVNNKLRIVVIKLGQRRNNSTKFGRLREQKLSCVTE